MPWVFEYSFISKLIFPKFANVHDVSWGTKGDNKVNTDLGVVKTGGNEAEVLVPTEQNDINAAYEDALEVLKTKAPKQESKPDAGTQQEDYYRTFRTKYVMEIQWNIYDLTYCLAWVTDTECRDILLTTIIE